MKLKCSFDFDGTLSRPDVQNLVRTLSSSGMFEVWIVTTRYEDPSKYHNDSVNHDDLFEVAKKLNIPRSRIVFTNMNWKYHFLDNKGFLFHLDDNPMELDLIQRMTLIKAFSVKGNFTRKILKSIKEA